MTQAQIGQRLGISRMQVSRRIARSIGYLRSHLLDLEATYRVMPDADPGRSPRSSGRAQGAAGGR
jgi:hypothetical protein